MHESIKRRYFEGNLDRSGHAVTEDACTESLLKAFDDPQYQKLLNLYGKCVRPTIRCEVCGENAVPGLLVKHGGFDSKANEIVLCCDVLSDKTLDTSVLNSVIHETIHAIDHCRSPLPDKSKVTCQQLLCIEARAYSCSNQCPQQDGQDRKDCLMRLLNLYTVGAPCQTTKDLDQALIDSKKQMEEALARKECICARPCKDGRLPETPENWELPPVAVK